MNNKKDNNLFTTFLKIVIGVIGFVWVLVGVVFSFRKLKKFFGKDTPKV